jgi:hypothetical protein
MIMYDDDISLIICVESRVFVPKNLLIYGCIVVAVVVFGPLTRITWKWIAKTTLSSQFQAPTI